LACSNCAVTSCNIGTRLASPCNGGGTSDDAFCETCINTCLPSEYMIGTCTSFTCTICSGSCETGSYISMRCDGKTDHDIECEPCVTSCSPGQYMVGSCSGTTTADSVLCVTCDNIIGQYKTAECSGTSSSNDALYSACKSTCPTGEYLDGECIDTSDYTCSTCRDPCGVAETEVVQCTTYTNRVCIPDASCSQQCPEGTYLTTPCQGSNTQRVCTPCSTSCSSGFAVLQTYDPGYYISTPCSATADIVCTACTSDCIGSSTSTQFYNAQSVLFCSGTTLYNEIICAVTDPYERECGFTHYKADFLMPHTYLFNLDEFYGYLSYQASLNTYDNSYTMKYVAVSLDWIIANHHWNHALSEDKKTLAITDVRGRLWMVELGEYKTIRKFAFAQTTDGLGVMTDLGGILWWGNDKLFAVSKTKEAVYLCHVPNWDTLTTGLSTFGGESLHINQGLLNCELYDAREESSLTYTTHHHENSHVAKCVYVATGSPAVLICSHNGPAHGKGFMILDTLSKVMRNGWKVPQTHFVYGAPTGITVERTLASNIAFDYIKNRAFVITYSDATSEGRYNQFYSRYLEVWVIPYDDYSQTFGVGTIVYNEGNVFSSSYTGSLAYSEQHNSIIYGNGYDGSYYMLYISSGNVAGTPKILVDDEVDLTQISTLTSEIEIVKIPDNEQLWFSVVSYDTFYYDPALKGVGMRTYCFPCMAHAVTILDSTSMSDCYCNAGYYMSNMAVCEPCKTTTGAHCDVGYYKTGENCAAGSTLDLSCARCGKICAPGYYIGDECDGTGTVDTTVCVPCKTKCGDSISSSCDAFDCIRGQVFLYHMDGGASTLGIILNPKLVLHGRGGCF
jgi:hypothetical protein